MSEISDRVRVALRDFLSGGTCPTPGCIGELAVVWPMFPPASGLGGMIMCATCYIWDAAFNDTAAIAQLVIAAGGRGPRIAHVLHDDDNGDRDGRTEDGTRAWDIVWHDPG